jgi:hypothetical protein
MAYRWLSVTTILAEVPGLDVHKLAYYRRERISFGVSAPKW